MKRKTKGRIQIALFLLMVFLIFLSAINVVDMSNSHYWITGIVVSGLAFQVWKIITDRNEVEHFLTEIKKARERLSSMKGTSEDGEIQDVDLAYVEYVREGRSPGAKRAGYIIIALLLLSFIPPLFFVTLPLLVIVGIWSNKKYGGVGDIRSRIYDDFLRQFAERNNFKLKKGGSIEQEKSIIFKEGKRRKIHHTLEGKFMDRPLRILNYTHSANYAYEKMELRYGPMDFTVFAVTFEGADIPRMLLDAKGVGELPCPSWMFKGLKLLELESNEFNNVYDLYVTEGQELAALQIFSPDLMAEFIDMPDKFDVEILEDTIYVYEYKKMTNKEDFEYMFKIVKGVVNSLDHFLERV